MNSSYNPQGERAVIIPTLQMGSLRLRGGSHVPWATQLMRGQLALHPGSLGGSLALTPLTTCRSKIHPVRKFLLCVMYDKELPSVKGNQSF